MRVRVLGSCAGGGLPQWNCGGPNSQRARAGDPAVPPRTQPSLAISTDGERWSILNASPDIRDQLTRFPGLHPRPGTRDVPLDTVVLTSAELDHVLQDPVQEGHVAPLMNLNELVRQLRAEDRHRIHRADVAGLER